MKIVIAFLFLAVLLTSVFGSAEDEQWAKFKVKYNRKFTAEEEGRRFEQFKKTLTFIQEHNAKYARGEISTRVGVNHYADRFDDEKKFSLGALVPGVPRR